MYQTTNPSGEMDLSQTQIESSWSREEFAGIELGDQRLNARFLTVSEALAAQPQASINHACEGWPATKGAYRLFKNEKTTPELILFPHQQRTRDRMAEYPLVLAVQDTTLVDYTGHLVTQGVGPIGTASQDRWGLVVHTTMAFTPSGLPLGLVSQDIWAREASAQGGAESRKSRPIEEKESYKWITALRETAALTPEGVTVVSVGDREADVYEMFQEAHVLQTKVLVRATQDRTLVEHGTLKPYMKRQPAAGHLKVEVPARSNRPGRTALVEVRRATVTLHPPSRPKTCDWRLTPLTVDVVWVHELNPPADVDDPLDWLLLTNVPVPCFADAVERVRRYKVRWQIEVWHKVLKSGCKVEACQLESGDRLIRYLTLKSVIAWKLFWLTHLNRAQPDAPCTVILTNQEWQALYATIHKTLDLPDDVPTVREATHWIAQLGGFLGRTGDGEPGVTVLWRGWQRLQDFVRFWRIVQQE